MTTEQAKFLDELYRAGATLVYEDWVDGLGCIEAKGFGVLEYRQSGRYGNLEELKYESMRVYQELYIHDYETVEEAKKGIAKEQGFEV